MFGQTVLGVLPVAWMGVRSEVELGAEALLDFGEREGLRVAAPDGLDPPNNLQVTIVGGNRVLAGRRAPQPLSERLALIRCELGSRRQELLDPCTEPGDHG